MISLLMIADDFTGALDTGVQFAASGVETRVVVGMDGALSLPARRCGCWWWTRRPGTWRRRRPVPLWRA